MADIFELFKKISKKKDTAFTPEFIVAGLGNPDEKYTFTRHNAGFLALDYISQKIGADVKNLKFKSLVGRTFIGGHSVLLMKPQTYMNKSGEAVKAAADFYKIPPEKIIVISDDVHQSPGKMRIRRSGSSGGQKGLGDIIEKMGTEDIPRIRIGVGEKPTPEYDMASWVLGKIPEEDQKKLFSVFGCVNDALPLILDGKTEDAMGKYNGISF
mgnify:CR=1 FL=1